MPSVSETYKVRLDQFEGPLDLLLHLIRKNKIEITDIPMAEITRQYLDALREMRRLNLDLAGEYLVMASTLMFIKSRMLLPAEPTEEGQEEDPRSELVEKLLTYERYQRAANLLLERPILFEDTFPRLSREKTEGCEEDLSIILGEISLETLAYLFKKATKNLKEPFLYLLKREKLNLQDKIQEILEKLQVTEDGIWLQELCAPPVTRLGVILTFLAILELARQRIVHLFQPGLSQDIRIQAV